MRFCDCWRWICSFYSSKLEKGKGFVLDFAEPFSLNLAKAKPVLIIFLILASCSSIKRDNSDVIIEQEENNFESMIVDVDTVEELALREVQSSQTDFEATAERHTEIMQRFWYFAETYNGQKPDFERKTNTAKTKGQSFTYILSWKGDSKAPKRKYSVTCRLNSAAITDDSELNAKNIARFLNTGTLEVSLLKQ